MKPLAFSVEENPLQKEWLIADGLGGYAMGVSNGMRTRRYHALLLVAAPDSEQRFALVNGVEAWIDIDGQSVPLNTHRYHPDTQYPTRVAHMEKYSAALWPTWELAWKGGAVTHEICGVHGKAATILRWTWRGEGAVTLRVRPQLAGRDWHALHRENSAFHFDAKALGRSGQRFAPYHGVPGVVISASAVYRHEPLWFRNLQLDDERARGLDYLEDLASPGEFVFELSASQPEAVMVLTTDHSWGGITLGEDVLTEANLLQDAERVRIEAFASPAERAADQFIVTRGTRRTIIAGYPWFTDWGRDTFIAVRGLCIATGRKADAEAILLSWCPHLSQGMMPNLFPSGSGEPQYNSVDASLWFVMAVAELAVGPLPNVPLPFVQAIEEILTQYSRGTRHGIRVDADGLLAAGAQGLALTWMDAVVDGQPVTPRAGKAVEVQALWINALEFASKWNKRWASVAAKARASFAKRFWNEKRQCLFDVVDVDHVAGAVDDRMRPNQILACGGLPNRVVSDEMAAAIATAVARDLHAGVGLRTLATTEPGYIGSADGPMRHRDLAYHQGTVWPWLDYAFWDAVFNAPAKSVRMPPLPSIDALELPEMPDEPPPEILAVASDPPPSDFAFPEFVGWLDASDMMAFAARHFDSFEIADGDDYTRHRGCAFQAWTVGESIRKQKRMAALQSRSGDRQA